MNMNKCPVNYTCEGCGYYGIPNCINVMIEAMKSVNKIDEKYLKLMVGCGEIDFDETYDDFNEEHMAYAMGENDDKENEQNGRVY